MKLSDYLEQTGTSDASFAAAVGTNRQTVWRWRQGHRPASRFVEAIARETRGAVTPNDLFLSAPGVAPGPDEVAA
jgi:transcriptional regulator with XRE-family HTH domain